MKTVYYSFLVLICTIDNDSYEIRIGISNNLRTRYDKMTDYNINY